jgi:hypothetical protein
MTVDNSFRQHVWRTAISAAHARAIKQTNRPHVELHRIVFARRKTAWATLWLERSADARVGRK